VDAFPRFTAANHVPVDFISTHAYADGTVEVLFDSNENLPMDERICRTVS
jgi:xylan 1,4-beta-xylosidase